MIENVIKKNNSRFIYLFILFFDTINFQNCESLKIIKK